MLDYWISTIARDTVVQQSQVMWGLSEKRRTFGIGYGRYICCGRTRKRNCRLWLNGFGGIGDVVTG